MKRYFYLFSLIGLVGCATTPSIPQPPQLSMNGDQRMSMCKLEALNEYIGTCYINKLIAEPNYIETQNYMAKYKPNLKPQWEIVIFTNEKLVSFLKEGRVTVEEANKLFKEALDNWDVAEKADIEQRIIAQQEADKKKGCMSLAFSSALNPALAAQNAVLMRNAGCGVEMPVPEEANTKDTKPALKPVQITGWLISESKSGLNKTCVYDSPSGNFSKTIAVSAVCPINAKQ